MYIDGMSFTIDFTGVQDYFGGKRELNTIDVEKLRVV